MSSEQLEMVAMPDMAPGVDFDPEVDGRELHSWFLDGPRSVPPMTPMYGWMHCGYGGRGTQYAWDELSIPTCKGWCIRYRHGAPYVGLYIVRDKEEIAKREVKFREALRPWIEDFDSLWAGYKKELLEIYNKLKELDVDNATAAQLYNHNHDLQYAYRRMWEIHFLGFASFYGWVVFEQMAKERFGLTDRDPEYQDMMRGFPNKVYDMDRDLWQFGQLATEMGLGDIFKKNDSKSIVTELEQSEKGKEWFKKFMDYLETDEVGGWRASVFNDFTEPYWLEEPSIPIGVIKDYVTMGADYALDATQPQLAKKRDQAIANFLRKVPPEEKDLWEGLIRLAGRVSTYSEEHGLYCELMVHAFMRRGYLAIGRRLARAGTIDKPEDVFMLMPVEIDRVLFAPEFHDMRYITRRRKAIWESWSASSPEPVITDRADFMEAVMNDMLPSNDVIAVKIVVGDQPNVIPEVNADIWGLCGCAGEAEGIARVCFVYDDLKNVNPGEILVCPATTPPWTPVYSIIKGVITDMGGTLSHAAIIGREYGIPTIVRTMESTAKIKSGQRIRIDATRGAVFLLDK